MTHRTIGAEEGVGHDGVQGPIEEELNGTGEEGAAPVVACRAGHKDEPPAGTSSSSTLAPGIKGAGS